MSCGIGPGVDPSPLTSLRLCHTAVVLPDDPSRDEHARHDDTAARAIAFLRAHAARQPQVMLRTRAGQVLSDTDVAQAVGAPRAQRSVGSALGANTIAWLIPCHRVIRDSGEISHYRWRPERKAAMLGWEAARAGSRNPGPPSA